MSLEVLPAAPLPAVPHNLPAQPTTLVGRRSEVAALCARLRGEGVRLLTLTGPAGTGKTRLALAVAEAAAAAGGFPHGVWLVPLAPVEGVAGVLPAVVRTLGIGIGGEPSAAESLRRYVGRKGLLLLLDNMEHVLGAGPEVAGLLDACPNLVLLATSREPLRVRWERLAPVSPLAVPEAGAPDADALSGVAPAVELFVQRARDVRPDFRLDGGNAAAVAEVCRRLDGLPLAIELAAARSRALPPQAILARLGQPGPPFPPLPGSLAPLLRDWSPRPGRGPQEAPPGGREQRLDLLVGGRRDEPPRLQTVRAALAWSHDLLTPPERALFRRLGVFTGGCTPETAAAVCDPAGSLGLDVLDGLESLLSKSLLRQEEVAGEPRFGMLETVRAYALEALQGSGELVATRRSHAAACAALVDAAAPGLRGPEQMAWLSRLDRERANIRSALEWLAAPGPTGPAGAGGAEADEAGAVERGLRMGAGLWWYWHVRGDYAEARRLLRPLLESPLADREGACWARALSAAGVAAWGLGDYATARAEQEQSLERLRALDDRPGVIQALIDLGCVAVSQGDGATAGAAMGEALALARDAGHDWQTAWALTFQGMLAIAGGDLPGAWDRFEESLAIRRRLGDTFGMAWSHHGLASVARLRGDGAAALPRYEACLATFRTLGERPTVASVLDGLGEVAIARGDFATARARFAESLALYQEMGSPRGVGIALSGFGALAAAEWRAERAVRLAGAAAVLHEAGGGAIELIRHRGSEGWLEEARRALGPEPAAAAWAAGQAMSPQAAVDYALAGPAGGAPPRQGSRPDGDGNPLTPREQEVARLVARGHSNRQIAEALVISERTAEAHLSHILAKLGLGTRVQLAAWAVARSPALAP